MRRRAEVRRRRRTAACSSPFLAPWGQRHRLAAVINLPCAVQSRINKASASRSSPCDPNSPHSVYNEAAATSIDPQRHAQLHVATDHRVDIQRSCWSTDSRLYPQQRRALRGGVAPTAFADEQQNAVELRNRVRGARCMRPCYRQRDIAPASSCRGLGLSWQRRGGSMTGPCSIPRLEPARGAQREGHLKAMKADRYQRQQQRPEQAAKPVRRKDHGRHSDGEEGDGYEPPARGGEADSTRGRHDGCRA